MEHKGWLIYNKEDAMDNKSYIDWFIEEGSKQNIKISLILRENIQIGILKNKPNVLLNNKIVELPDFAIVRTIDPFLTIQMEQMGISVFNPSSIAIKCNHKYLTHMEVSKLGIPMVDTYFLKKKQLPALPPFPYPFVIKDPNGRGGRSVFLVEQPKEWDKTVAKTENDFIIQTCNVQLGKDIRVFVVGKEIIGAVLRNNPNDFRANFKLGGSATWYELSNKELTTVNKIIEHFDFGMVGIDFLMDMNNNLLFNEIEDIVGSRTLSKVSSINILEKYITYIKDKLSTNY